MRTEICASVDWPSVTQSPKSFINMNSLFNSLQALHIFQLLFFPGAAILVLGHIQTSPGG